MKVTAICLKSLIGGPSYKKGASYEVDSDDPLIKAGILKVIGKVELKKPKVKDRLSKKKPLKR